MPDAKLLKALHAAVERAEYALAQVGEGLTFQVKPEGGLEGVRRGEGGMPTGDPVVDLAGADRLERLRRPAELERLLPLFEERLERLKEWLADIGDAEAAVDSLEEMARLLRLAQQPEDGE